MLSKSKPAKPAGPADPEVRNTIEAALMTAQKPLSVQELGRLFARHDPQRPSRELIRATVTALAEDYADRGVELVEVASGLRIQARTHYAGALSRLWEEKPPRYSRALLETLAIIAYRQPVTRGDIESIRGIGVNTNIIRTLTERCWIRAVGHREVPGHPELFATTREFLDYFGLQRLSDLPPLPEPVAGAAAAEGEGEGDGGSAAMASAVASDDADVEGEPASLPESEDALALASLHVVDTDDASAAAAAADDEPVIVADAAGRDDDAPVVPEEFSQQDDEQQHGRES